MYQGERGRTPGEWPCMETFLLPAFQYFLMRERGLPPPQVSPYSLSFPVTDRLPCPLWDLEGLENACSLEGGRLQPVSPNTCFAHWESGRTRVGSEYSSELCAGFVRLEEKSQIRRALPQLPLTPLILSPMLGSKDTKFLLPSPGYCWAAGASMSCLGFCAIF